MWTLIRGWALVKFPPFSATYTFAVVFTMLFGFWGDGGGGRGGLVETESFLTFLAIRFGAYSNIIWIPR